MSYGKISAKQKEILEYIKQSILSHGYPPAVREICEAVHLKSTSSVHSHLETLEKNGYIRRDPSKPRAIEIIDDNFNLTRRELVNVPIVGTVTAGEPILAIENIQGYFPIMPEFVNNKQTFMLKVKGESMINAGIFDGDFILVEETPTASDNDIIVALLEDSVTVKRFFKEEFDVENKILWLPDVFGYSGALPQIMAKCGIDYFMTTKLAWNQFNKMPYDTFKWRGIDGTEILTHLVTTLGVGQSENDFFTTYNGILHPDALIGGWHRYQQKDINNDILISYGYGDGGGGPTAHMLENYERLKKGLPGLPKVTMKKSADTLAEIHEQFQKSAEELRFTLSV